ncbi:UDP-N-acetylglucosamine 2-epimerase (hydrolyzing) [Paraneptunicella aestuarii]|uniref:UDP-N-acetylglucosamine 2-epimerase n=1 Tax=Paraneptunicella aestuarii TaxID=2831148 RepID=UPI001E583062|nr:UDP-N-acetylglucosamine 2-epimerase [Paraneptunicella aestuarii]UAA39149.1 UDP-N-acetylglucosamine 2-epimerase (hydrolyzing) [Paraneptunicella aestuarii]
MKVCVVTGTRAEYGLFYWLLKALDADPFFELKLIVTGMHLSPEFGSTYREIEADGFIIHDKVDIHLSGDSPVDVSKSTGLALAGIAESFRNLQPDLVILLGDRFEALGAAQAAMFANIPIAHLHGGEATFGAMDESIRHAISKLSHIHFPATETYRKRLIQMGELPENVHHVGALGVESATKTERMSLSELEASIQFDLGERFFLVTYHPVTLDAKGQQEGMESLLNALDCFPDVKVLLTFPNADTYGRQLINKVKEYAQNNPERVYLTESLGRVRYLSALAHCGCVIGNSSSGIIEAPSFKVATVNIGSRQQGRVCANSVLHCDNTQHDIESAIKEAMKLRASGELSSLQNPYDGGSSSEKIVSVLKSVSLSSLTKKYFYDLP